MSVVVPQNAAPKCADPYDTGVINNNRPNKCAPDAVCLGEILDETVAHPADPFPRTDPQIPFTVFGERAYEIARQAVLLVVDVPNAVRDFHQSAPRCAKPYRSPAILRHGEDLIAGKAVLCRVRALPPQAREHGNAAAVGADPDPSPPVLEHAKDEPLRTSLFDGVHNEIAADELIQSTGKGADPHRAFPVDENGVHGLTCKLMAGCESFHRHTRTIMMNAKNSVVRPDQVIADGIPGDRENADGLFIGQSVVPNEARTLKTPQSRAVEADPDRPHTVLRDHVDRRIGEFSPRREMFQIGTSPAVHAVAFRSDPQASVSRPAHRP